MEAQVALISKFCAVEGTFCERLVPYRGTNSYFFAYPSGAHWEDFTSLLASELEFQEVYGTRWQDVISNNVLFLKVCDLIHGHDYLFAEVTEPNANVLLEVGYALAVGRPPILLKDKRRPDWNRTLLTAFENCFYDTRESIVPHIVQAQANREDLIESPDRRLPSLEKMGIFEPVDNTATIHHLKPKIARDWISSVDRVLKDSPFEVSGTDPTDSSYDEFYPQARAIQGASKVVASLLGTDIQHYEEHNANVAMLIGFAIGLGKDIYVLQSEPRASILDLGTVSNLFTTESQAIQLVRRWVDIQTRAAIHQRAEAHTRARESENIAQLRRVYLGHPDALADGNLLGYFVPTPEYEDAAQGLRTMYVGRRGTGKSANFKAISEDLRNSFSTVPVEIAPSDYELQRISEYLESNLEATPAHLYGPTWNYVLTTEMVKSLAERTDRLLLSESNSDSDAVKRYYDENRTALELDFGTRVTQALMAQLEPSETNLLRTSQEVTQTAINDLMDYRIQRLLFAFAKRERLTFFLLADDLDKNWRPSNQQSIELLMGLINEADRLRRVFEDQVKVAIFLRQDIFDEMARQDDDFPKRSFMRMEWTPDSLKHVVAERLARGSNAQGSADDEIWSAVFREDVNGAAVPDYIITRSLPRPRDVLALCQSAIDQAKKNGHSWVTAQDITDGEKANSTDMVRALEAEFAASYPELGVILNVFSRTEPVLTWDDFTAFAELALEDQRESLRNWAASRERNPRWFAASLYEIGFIGLSRQGMNNIAYRDGRSFDETWAACAPNPRIHIHPAFYALLGI